MDKYMVKLYFSTNDQSTKYKYKGEKNTKFDLEIPADNMKKLIKKRTFFH